VARVTLPDGSTVHAFSRFEARLLYREIVSERSYEGHGITLAPGATVFDIGANIGMFAVHLAKTVPGVRLRCFEPMPPTFALLQTNLAEHAPDAVAVNEGFAATAGHVALAFDRFSSISTARDPGVFAQATAGIPVWRWAAAALADFERVEPGAMVRGLKEAVERPATRPLALAAMAPIAAALEVRKRIFQRTYRCTMRTLSQELAASGFTQLDLVKIDVEGAEEDVLAGIDDADWPRIRQLVIEVHDVNGRLQRLSRMLAARGYVVACQREDWSLHELMGISALYAIRREPPLQ
jgi:31-O-methyltransferase